MGNSTPGQDILPQMMLRLTVVDKDSEEHTQLELPFLMICQILPILKSSSPSAVRQLALLGAIGAMHPNLPTEKEIHQIGRVLSTLEITIAERWRNREEMLIQATYALLRDGSITRRQAAAVAKAALGKDINEESWRKRVDRYANAPERKWPLPGKPRGGSR